MTQKKTPRITKYGKMPDMDKGDYQFWFSSDINDWITSKRRSLNTNRKK
jgi:hypothetical protein